MPDPQPSDCRQFPATQWTLVRSAARDQSEQGRQALEQLLRRYLPAMRAHLTRGKRVDPDRADDLLQSFIAEKVLERHIISLADQTRGRFRTFLLKALDHFISNVHRARTARKRSPDKLASIDAGDAADSVPDRSEAADPFDLAWAKEVLHQALSTMQAECVRSGRIDIWEVFQHRIQKPLLEHVEPLSYEELVRRFALQSPRQAANLLMTAKRSFERAIRTVIAEYAESEDEIDGEIRDLTEILSKAGADSLPMSGIV